MNNSDIKRTGKITSMEIDPEITRVGEDGDFIVTVSAKTEDDWESAASFTGETVQEAKDKAKRFINNEDMKFVHELE